MTFLSPHLDFPAPTKHESPSALPAAGTHLVITDTLTAPSTFAVHHLAIAAASSKVPVIWVDLRNEGKASWDAVARKLGAAGPVVHIAPSPLPPPLGAPSLFPPGGASLRPTYDAIAAACAPNALVMLDGLSNLLYSGFSPSEISRFVRAVAGLTRRHGARLVSTLHADHLPRTESEVLGTGANAELLERMLALADGWWRVAGLASGRSGDVSGEISAHDLSSGGGWAGVPRARPLQYRLEAAGVKVFAKGTGRGFL